MDENKQEGAGRPTKFTKEVVDKLEQALQNGFTIGKACSLAQIDRKSYYNYIDADEDFSTKMELAKNFALERARQVVVKAVNDGDVSASKWYLERKDGEFKNKVSNELSGTVEVTNEHSILKDIAEGLKGLVPDDNAGDTTQEETSS